MNEIMSDVKDLVARSSSPPDEPLPAGATDWAIAELEQRTGLEVPGDLRSFLLFSNGPCVGPGGLMGINAVKKSLDMEHVLGLYPKWLEKGWIPAAGDGCGNYYLVVTRNDFGPGEPVVFIETIESHDTPAFVVASGMWQFVRFLLRKELGESRWPFARDEVVAADPGILSFRGVSLPWEG